jgi:hypothetical protein
MKARGIAATDDGGPAPVPLFPDNRLTGSYSGPEVGFWEASFR